MKSFRKSVSNLVKIDSDFNTIETIAGKLTPLAYPPTFASLVRIIAGQQLSSKAANAIFNRLNTAIVVTPSTIALTPQSRLRELGMSTAKAACCQELAFAVIEQKIKIASFPNLSDETITNQLLQIKGIGKWTVDIYLLFCLARNDTLPANDLAIQISYQKLKKLKHRPTAKELIERMETLKPYRGIASHLLWHIYPHLKSQW